METEWIVVILLLITVFWLMWIQNTQCIDEQEDFTSGFGVVTGLTFYNKNRQCRDGDINEYGSHSPYCESIGTVIH